MQHNPDVDLSILFKSYITLSLSEDRRRFASALFQLPHDEKGNAKVTAVLKAQNNNDLLRFKKSLQAYDPDHFQTIRLEKLVENELSNRRLTTGRGSRDDEIEKYARKNLLTPENTYALEGFYKEALENKHLSEDSYAEDKLNNGIEFKLESHQLKISWPDPTKPNERILTKLTSDQTLNFAGQSINEAKAMHAKNKLVQILQTEDPSPDNNNNFNNRQRPTLFANTTTPQASSSPPDSHKSKPK